jgi:hypothetical protein
MPSVDLHANILKADTLPCSQEAVSEDFLVGNGVPSAEERATVPRPEEVQASSILSSDLWVNGSANG